MSEVPLQAGSLQLEMQYLSHASEDPLGTPQDPRHRPTVGCWKGAFSYQRGTPAGGVVAAGDAIPLARVGGPAIRAPGCAPSFRIFTVSII